VATITLESAHSLLPQSGYGPTVARIAQALATRRLYSVTRSAPIPLPMRREVTLRARFYGALEAELAPLRARIAALDSQVSEQLSLQGIHRGPEADAWFETQQSDWRNLRVEPPPSIRPDSDSERLILQLPGVFVESLFGEEAIDSPRRLRLAVERGLTPRQRQVLSLRHLAPLEAEILAYFEATLAMRSHRVSHFAEVVSLLSRLGTRSAAAELLLATALSARTALPKDVPPSTVDSGAALDTSALEALARGPLPERERAFALHNAAWLWISTQAPKAVAEGARLLAESTAISPNEPCLGPLSAGGFIERAERPCDLPGLP